MTSRRLTAAERKARDEERKAMKEAEARSAMAEQAARATAFNNNRERLKSARLALEAEAFELRLTPVGLQALKAAVRPVR